MGVSERMGVQPDKGDKGRNEGASRRRTERILLSIPIRVEGQSPRGEKFVENSRTVVINRHGARILLRHAIASGGALKIENLAAHRKADFRVVGPTGPADPGGGEWGVECTDEKSNIWGIEFPPQTEGAAQAMALLQCRVCNKESFLPISMIEHDVLSSSGLLSRDCSTCGRRTQWSYPDHTVVATAAGLDEVSGAAERASGVDQRMFKRASLRLPIRIRDYYGGVDLTKSENVSKGGICFMSDKDYEVGAGILVTCPYNAAGHSIEVRARVVRRQVLSGNSQKIYGVQYEQVPLA